ncbi:putative ABC transporter ATP-binding protein [Candidatus Gugararchaeum adminiculabundum]|nr:putative ABC transporter ATP-binding protein [Candidatus Gugararchaeum adminiculabundum]
MGETTTTRTDAGGRTETEYAVRISGIGKRYGSRLALDDVSLNVEKGTVYCIAGPNGSGKTTLLSIIAGALRPSKGSVKVSGSVGYAFQVPRLFGDLTVRENMEFFRKLTRDGKRDGEGWMEKSMKILELDEWLNVPCERLSSGAKKRVELGIALLQDPEILLLDEPTAGLDVDSLDEVVSLVQKLKQVKTVIITTHQIRDFERACDTLCIILAGRKVYERKINEIGKGQLEQTYKDFIGKSRGNGKQ